MPQVQLQRLTVRAVHALLRCHTQCLLQAVRVGSAAVATQCRAIDAWAARVGARKRPVASTDADAMAALQERIAGLAAGDIEEAYRSIQGACPRKLAMGFRVLGFLYP